MAGQEGPGKNIPPDEDNQTSCTDCNFLENTTDVVEKEMIEKLVRVEMAEN